MLLNAISFQNLKRNSTLLKIVSKQKTANILPEWFEWPILRCRHINSKTATLHSEYRLGLKSLYGHLPSPCILGSGRDFFSTFRKKRNRQPMTTKAKSLRFIVPQALAEEKRKWKDPSFFFLCVLVYVCVSYVTAWA